MGTQTGSPRSHARQARPARPLSGECRNFSTKHPRSREEPECRAGQGKPGPSSSVAGGKLLVLLCARTFVTLHGTGACPFLPTHTASEQGRGLTFSGLGAAEGLHACPPRRVACVRGRCSPEAAGPRGGAPPTPHSGGGVSSPRSPSARAGGAWPEGDVPGLAGAALPTAPGGQSGRISLVPLPRPPAGTTGPQPPLPLRTSRRPPRLPTRLSLNCPLARPTRPSELSSDGLRLRGPVSWAQSPVASRTNPQGARPGLFFFFLGTTHIP